MLIGSCKKDNPVIEPTLQGLWRMDTRGTYFDPTDLKFDGDSVIQTLQVYQYPIGRVLKYNRGTFRIKADTSILYSPLLPVYSGSYLKCKFYENGLYVSFFDGIYQLSKDSFIIDTYCCRNHLSFYRVKE